MSKCRDCHIDAIPPYSYTSPETKQTIVLCRGCWRHRHGQTRGDPHAAPKITTLDAFS